MAGIYIHIPFCRKACHYCNFHFSTNLTLIDQVVDAICLELNQRKSYMLDEVKTIYFGGGTPSVLSIEQLGRIFDSLVKNYFISAEEITLECNPEDLDAEILEQWQTIGINRLSIGVQSFYDNHLQWMNRSHTGDQAKEAIRLALESGFDNLSADLIYGFTLLHNDQLATNIKTLAGYAVNHISAYSLTIEPKTALHHQTAKGLYQPMLDQNSNEQMTQLIDLMEGYSYKQYEVSNFAKLGYEALHNSNYWEGKKYLGVGPGAHSYNGTSRRWNVNNNIKYFKSVYDHTVYYEEEVLSKADSYNEYIMLNLRRREGIDLNKLKIKFPEFGDQFETQLKDIDAKYLVQKDGHLSLSREGIFVADRLSSNLFNLD